MPDMEGNATAALRFHTVDLSGKSDEEKLKLLSMQCKQSPIPVMLCNSVHACNYPEQGVLKIYWVFVV